MFWTDPTSNAIFWGPVIAALLTVWLARSANRRDKVTRYPPNHAELQSLRSILDGVVTYNKHLQETNTKLLAEISAKDLTISKYVAEIRRLKRGVTKQRKS